MPYPEILATLGDHLMKRRFELGLRQKEAAPHLGVNEWTVRNWEKGGREPAIRLWPRIIEFLGYDPDAEPEILGQRIEWVRRRDGSLIP
jgi:DNA-binding XRE family transcriptional regulator